MTVRIVLASIAVGLVLTILASLQGRPAHAAPGWQLPWPTGNQQRIQGGNTYDCGDHLGTGKYAIDFWFDPSVGGPVASVAAGTVDQGYTWALGNYIDIDHGGGFVSRYADLATFSVPDGSFVPQGQVIGIAGSSGGPSTGIHLHFVIYLNGGAYKPEPMSNIGGFGQYGFSKDDGSCDYDGDSPNWTSSPPFSSNMLVDPSFESQSVCDPPGACAWRRRHVGPGETTNWSLLSCCSYPYYGTWFLRFNSTVPGGSVYQDIGALPYPSSGDSYIFSLYMRAPSGCVLATLRLWGVVGNPESNPTRLSVCSTGWTNYRVPLDVQLANNFVRAEIYVDQANKNLDIDYGEVIQVMHENASFESANFCDTCAWRRLPNPSVTNWSRIQDLNRNANASGEWFLRMNRTVSTGGSSLYQDIPIVASPGQGYVLKVWMRQGAPWPAPLLYGTLRLWALDGSPNESASLNFTLGQSYWVEYTVTLNVSQPHTRLRAEIYLTSPVNTNFDFDGTRVYRSY